MSRKIPIWAFLFTILVLLLFAVFLAWAAKSRAQGSQRLGWAGTAAYEVASFPKTVQVALKQLLRESLGGKANDDIGVPGYSAPDIKYQKVKVAPGLDLDGLELWSDRDRLRPGWRVLSGVFSQAGDFQQGAVLLSPDLEAVHFWATDEADTAEMKARPASRKLLHGLSVLADGSLIFSYDGGVSLQRVDWCGRVLWQVPGEYHHAVTASEDEKSVWSLRDNDLVEVDSQNGSILREVSLKDMRAANPGIDIFGARQRLSNGFNERGERDSWLEDPFHNNDVDPLPPSMVDAFGGLFEADDLLVSMRSLNLVYVIDPDSAVVKWWRSGAWVRQHDPDWLATGEIGVFDNRMNRDFSRIAAIDPDSLATRTLVAGADYDFYSRYRGKFQVTDEGAVLVTSSQQGRAFEIDANGEKVLEIVNRNTLDRGANYVLSQAIWLPEEALTPATHC